MLEDEHDNAGDEQGDDVAHHDRRVIGLNQNKHNLVQTPQEKVPQK